MAYPKHGITFGDFNGDGKSDMLLTSWQDDQTKMDGHNGAYYFQRETEPLKNLCTQDGRCP